MIIKKNAATNRDHDGRQTRQSATRAATRARLTGRHRRLESSPVCNRLGIRVIRVRRILDYNFRLMIEAYTKLYLSLFNINSLRLFYASSTA